jgi:indolepyruvate ferredoxin oxidoreductase beta subunit
VVVNTQRITPMSASVGDAVYPSQESILGALRERAGRVVTVDGLALAKEAGTSRAANTVVLGALSALMDTPPKVWEEAIVRRVPPSYSDVNRRAFNMGRQAVAA